jgi:succinyl-diaminopimelate desuccinylase
LRYIISGRSKEMNSPTKELLIAEIEKNKKELISLCSDLIKIDSSNPPGDMGEITSFITNFLSKHKISWEILDKTGSTPNIIAKIGPDCNQGFKALV